MPKEMIKDLSVACAKLEEDFWDLQEGHDVSVLMNIDSTLFLDKENVQKMADAIAKNLRANFENETVDYNKEQLENYGKQIVRIKKNFERTVQYKAMEARDIDPIKAKKAEIKGTINQFGKDII